MGNTKLDTLLWENIPSGNLILKRGNGISKESLEELPVDYIDELYIYRDMGYGIKISCAQNRIIFKEEKTSRKNQDEFLIPGSPILPGKLIIHPYGDENYRIVVSHCFWDGSSGTFNRIEHNISCDHVEGELVNKPAKILKEWILNADADTFRVLCNKRFTYSVESSTYGAFGDMEFPARDMQLEKKYFGYYAHFTFKDTAFDVHRIGDDYGPKWSDNISISYYDAYGRIPSAEERKIIRDYFSFIAGRRLIYIGNSKFDEVGNQIGFEMETPKTAGFNIEGICKNVAHPPIYNRSISFQAYFDTIQKHLVPFSDLYVKLGFESLLESLWYSNNLVVPYNLPIISSALEGLIKNWFDTVESNPNTLLMDRKDFANIIKPLKDVIAKQYEGTDYIERMQRSIERMNCMGVNERIVHFFNRIGVNTGAIEMQAIRARNNPAHGSIKGEYTDYENLHRLGKVYECLIIRTLLRLIGYEGKYVDYGTLGFPNKSVNEPSGELTEI